MEKPLGLSTSRLDESRRQLPHHVHGVASGVVSPSSAKPPGLGVLKQEVPVDRSSPSAPPGLGVKSSKCEVRRCESSKPPEKPPGLEPPKREALKQDPKSSVFGEGSVRSKHGSDRATRSELAPPGLGATPRPPGLGSTPRPPQKPLGSDSEPIKREVQRYDTKLSTHSGKDPTHLKLNSDRTRRSEVCQDWRNGRCSRGHKCPYLHENLVFHKVSVQCHDHYIHVPTIRRLSTRWSGMRAPQTDRQGPEVMMCAGTGREDIAPENLRAAICIATSSRRT